MLQGHTQSTNLVVVGPSLKGWEYREVNLVLKVVLAALRLALLQSVSRLLALHTMHASGDSQAGAIVLSGTDQTLLLLEVQTARLTASIRRHQEVDICIVTAMHLY